MNVDCDDVADQDLLPTASLQAAAKRSFDRCPASIDPVGTSSLGQHHSLPSHYQTARSL